VCGKSNNNKCVNFTSTETCARTTQIDSLGPIILLVPLAVNSESRSYVSMVSAQKPDTIG